MPDEAFQNCQFYSNPPPSLPPFTHNVISLTSCAFYGTSQPSFRSFYHIYPCSLRLFPLLCRLAILFIAPQHFNRNTPYTFISHSAPPYLSFPPLFSLPLFLHIPTLSLSNIQSFIRLAPYIFPRVPLPSPPATSQSSRHAPNYI